MIKILMHGCNGKMGQTITRLAAEDENVEIAAGVDPYDGITNTYPVFADIKDCTVQADVVVDFASAKAVDGLLDYCEKTLTPLVLCTTGLSEAQLLRVEEVSKKTAVLKSANMSLGVNTIIKLVQAAAEILANAGFDMEIVEKHHNLKVDAPSGTALALADAMNAAMKDAYHYEYNRSAKRERRDAKEIGISSVRGGTIVGEHEVIFAGTDEIVEIKHTAYSKAIFAKGAIQAARFLAGKPAGYYQMSDVIQG